MNITTQVGICNLALMRLGEDHDLTTVSGEGKPYTQIEASYDLLREELLSIFSWHFSQKRKELDYTVTRITAATQAEPVVLTVADITDFPDGCLAEITHVDGMTELNDETFFLDNRNTTANTVELFNDDPEEQDDVTGTDTINTHEKIDGTGYSAWSANGQLRRVPYGFLYCYDLPSDCLAVTTLMTSDGIATDAFEVNLDKLYTDLDDAFIEYGYQITDDTTPIFHSSFINCFAWRLAAEWAYSLTDDIDVEKEMWKQYEKALTAAQTRDARENPRDYSYTDPFIHIRG